MSENVRCGQCGTHVCAECGMPNTFGHADGCETIDPADPATTSDAQRADIEIS